MSKEAASKSSIAKEAKAQRNARAKNSSAPAAPAWSTPEATEAAWPLGFASLAAFAAFTLFGFLLFIAPYLFSGFWPSSYEYWPQALFLALLACVCVLLALNPKPTTDHRPPTTAWLLAAFGMWCALSLFGTVYLHDSILELARVSGVLACFFIARALLGSDENFVSRATCLLAAAIAGGICVCVPAILDFFITRNPRQFATFYNPNLFANCCAMLLPLSASGVLQARKSARETEKIGERVVWVLGFAVVAIIALGLIVTSSKGGFLAALSGMTVFVLAVFRAKGERVLRVLQARRMAFAIIALLFLVGAGFVFSQTILPRLSSNLENDHSTMFRVYTWAGTWRMAAARPLLGWGTGSFPSAYPGFAETGYTRSAHQSWLQIASESGFPAMLFLLAACAFAFARGWKLLRGNRWPITAGSLGALTAFCVHGLFDSGWNIVSIGVLLMAILAFLENAGNKKEELQSSSVNPKSSIHWPFLLAALPLAFGSWLCQRAQSGEDLRSESRALMGRGAPSLALEKAREARSANPLNARLWDNVAQIENVAPKQIPSADNYWLYQRIIELQPTRALNYLSYAEYSIQANKPQDETSSLFDKAVKFDSNDTEIRFARGKWRLGNKDASGWKDIEFIAALQDKPYGKYPATPEMVDLNFARAFALLAERDAVKNPAAAKTWIAKGLKTISQGRKYEPERRRMEQESRGAIDESRAQTMDELEPKFKNLQAKIR